MRRQVMLRLLAIMQLSYSNYDVIVCDKFCHRFRRFSCAFFPRIGCVTRCFRCIHVNKINNY